MNQLVINKLKEIFHARGRYLRLPWHLKWHEGIAYLCNQNDVTLARYTLGSSSDCEAAVEAVNVMPEILETYERLREILIYLRPEVLRFAMAMEEELRRNDHKGGWKNVTDVSLMVRLQQEIDD